jgi:hypothetical protein
MESAKLMPLIFNLLHQEALENGKILKIPKA